MNHQPLGKAQKVNEILSTKIKKSDFPSIQYAVLDSNQIVFEYVGGWADIKNQIPMKPDTTMMAYSMTKTITAAAVLQLIEKKRLSLSDNLDKFIHNNPYCEKITINHLLSQTSGILNPIPLRQAHLAEKLKEFDEDASLAKILKKHSKISFEPSEKYAYSNISYWFLGKIIEKVSGQTYSNYMMENIFNPLQLAENEMSYTIHDYTNHTKGYLAKYSFSNLFKNFLIDRDLIGGYEGKWLHIKSNYLNGPAFGGIVGSARSFGRFLQDQLSKKSVLFNKEAKELFYSQQTNNFRELVGMTLVWHISNLEGRDYFFKSGEVVVIEVK